ncbi:unnamed protein product [Closterium sp. Naga37s-1]|nr:unnamed protein product [Closterium sp. Naga37s-1]
MHDDADVGGSADGQPDAKAGTLSPFVGQIMVPGDVAVDLKQVTSSVLRIGPGLRQEGDMVVGMRAGRLKPAACERGGAAEARTSPRATRLPTHLPFHVLHNTRLSSVSLPGEQEGDMVVGMRAGRLKPAGKRKLWVDCSVKRVSGGVGMGGGSPVSKWHVPVIGAARNIREQEAVGGLQCEAREWHVRGNVCQQSHIHSVLIFLFLPPPPSHAINAINAPFCRPSPCVSLCNVTLSNVYSHHQYTPAVEEAVIGIVLDKHMENLDVDIKGPGLAILPALAFEGATRRNRPNLQIGQAVYTRVVKTHRDADPELSCVDASGKAAEFGPLVGGHLFDCSTALARLLLATPTAPVSKALDAAGLAFEIAVGLNGRVKGDTIKNTILVANAAQNSEFLSAVQQRAMVKELVRLSPHGAGRGAVHPESQPQVLRMEQDVERFIRNPSLQVMEFQPMASSYHRAAAHRVAQHYSLQTSAADSVTPSGGECTVVIARKIGELRPPPVRLVDLPLGPTSGSGSGGAAGAGAVNGVGAGAEAAPGPGGFKLAIRRRPSGGRGGAAGDGEGGMGGSSADGADGAGVIRSVEERKEMYNRARARIFNTAQVDAVDSEESTGSAEGAGGKGEVGGKQEEGKAGGKAGAEAGGKTGAKAGAEAGGKGSGKGKGSGGGSGGEEKVGADKQGLTKSSSGGRKARNVAILRDREKEKQDPDYQRGYDRFSQRFDPGFGAQAPNPYNMQPIYAPVVTYASEFPSLSPSAPANAAAAAGNRTGRGGPGGAGPARPVGPAPGPAPNASVHGPGQSPGSVGAGSAGLIQPGFPGAGFPPGSFPPGNLPPGSMPPGGLPMHFQQIPTLGPPHPLNVWRAHAAVGMMAMHGRGVMPMPGPVPGSVSGALPGAVPGSAPGPVPYGLVQPPSSMPGSVGSPGGVGMGMTGSAATAAGTGAGRGVGPGFPPNLQRDGIMGPGAISVPSVGGSKDRQQHALVMYLTIFDICPEAKPLFSMVRESTEPSPVNPRLEAHATLAFTMMCEAFSNWDDPERVAKQTPFFRALGGRHLNYGIDGDDFPIFRTGFMKALQRAFGEEWFGDLEAAWCAAFDILVDMASSGMAEKGGQKVIPPAALEMLERMQQQ